MKNMDLKYIREHEIHEKYVMNLLDDQEKAVYEAFIKTNEQAQRELAETKKLITGIKSVGSETMKKEIQKQVDSIRHPKTDWSILYKAAAVLFIFVIVPSVIYLQFNRQEELILPKTTSIKEKQIVETPEPIQAAPPENEEADQDAFEVMPTHPAEKKEDKIILSEKRVAEEKPVSRSTRKDNSTETVIGGLDMITDNAGGKAISNMDLKKSKMPPTKGALSAKSAEMVTENESPKHYVIKTDTKTYYLNLKLDDSLPINITSLHYSILGENKDQINIKVPKAFYNLEKSKIQLQAMNDTLMLKFNSEIYFIPTQTLEGKASRDTVKN